MYYGLSLGQIYHHTIDLKKQCNLLIANIPKPQLMSYFQSRFITTEMIFLFSLQNQIFRGIFTLLVKRYISVQ